MNEYFYSLTYCYLFALVEQRQYFGPLTTGTMLKDLEEEENQ